MPGVRVFRLRHWAAQNTTRSSDLALMCVREMIMRRLTLCFLIFACAASLHAGLSGTETALDNNRKAALQQFDAWFTTGPQDTQYPAPNATITRPAANHLTYLNKALAVFALVDIGAAAYSRRDEANRILRYTILGRWPATHPGHVRGVNNEFDRSRRTICLRIYALYRNWLDADNRAEIEKRLDWMLEPPFNGSSENHRVSCNACYLLAHEWRNATHLQSYIDIKNWFNNWFRQFGEKGALEWGSEGYHGGITLSGFLNVAEFSGDSQMRDRATRVLDYMFAQIAAFSINKRNIMTGTRCSPGAHCTRNADTGNVFTLFAPVGSVTANEWTQPQLAASNYQPLLAVQAMFASPGNGEVRMRLDVPQFNHTTTHWGWRTGDYLLAGMPNVAYPDFYGTPGERGGGAAVVVQSRAGALGRVAVLGVTPGTSGGMRSKADMMLPYRNVALYNGGGETKETHTSAGGANVPIYLFYSHDFTREVIAGWVFLTNGTTYVAWAPAVGDPIVDPAGSTYPASADGTFLRSSHAPGIEGEPCVLEVGDAGQYGNYATFKAQVQSRNTRPRRVNGILQYTAPDGSVLRLGQNLGTVNGMQQSFNYPRISAPGLNNYTITHGGANIAFDFVNHTTSGSTPRVASNMTWGVSSGMPLTITTAAALPAGVVGQPWGPVGLQASGGIAPYAAWQVIGPDPLPQGIQLDPATGTLSGTPAQAGLFDTRIRVYDSANPVQVTSRVFNFSFASAPVPANSPPFAPTLMYVGTAGAQSGSASPASGIGLTPVFSAVFTDPDAGDTAAAVWVQVATAAGFGTGTLLWNAIPGQQGAVTIASCANGARCADIPYGGMPLANSTLYYWRMLFVDQFGNIGVASAAAEFTTIGHAPGQPATLFVGGTSAQSGRAGSVASPAAIAGLNPVFSAVFEDADAADTAVQAWLQVGTDTTWTSPSLVWNATPGGQGAINIAHCAVGDRCEDIAYGGAPLIAGTRYYWRMLFVDQDGLSGAASETSCFIPGSGPGQVGGRDGNGEPAGCAAATGGALALWLAPLIALRRRRR